MRWIATYTESAIMPGSTRLKRIFAWRPRNISGVVVWLEYYEVLQGYEVKAGDFILDNKPIKFSISQWINISERIIERK
jgi:hypothetical protein